VVSEEERNTGREKIYPSDGPEEILVLTFVGNENLARGSDHLSLEHGISSQPIESYAPPSAASHH
jgi:hypothetical protein